MSDVWVRVRVGQDAAVARLRPCAACSALFDPDLGHAGRIHFGGSPRRYCSTRCRARVARSRQGERADVLCGCFGQIELPGFADVA